MQHLGYIAIDQYGQTYKLTEPKHPRKQLLDMLGANNAQKMYIDIKGGGSKHIGYIINGLWLTIYNIYEWSK